MHPTLLAISNPLVVPAVGAGLGLGAAAATFLMLRATGRAAMLLRFFAALALTWVALCGVYVLARPAMTFGAYLRRGEAATITLAAAGAVWYLAAFIVFQPGDRQWRRSSLLLAGVALAGAAFLRAAYQPAITLRVQAPVALLLVATVWRFQAETLVYLCILAVAVTGVLAAPTYLASAVGGPEAVHVAASRPAWTTTTASLVSAVMAAAASLLALKRRQEGNVRWYRQGLLIVPLVVSTLAATAAGYEAVWYGVTWHTVAALGVWWGVLLASAIGLKQPDLFGFSSFGAGLAALALFAVLGGDERSGYWGRYPAVLMGMAFGAAVLSALLAGGPTWTMRRAFARALYLAAVAIAVAAITVEPFDMVAKYVGIDLLVAALVLVLAHAHGAPAWVNYLAAGLATGGAAALAHLAAPFPYEVWHHRFIQVLAVGGTIWILLALGLREVIRRASSDRTARRQAEPLAVTGMAMTLALAAYLTAQQVRAYHQLMTEGESGLRPILGPGWGLAGWLAVLLAFFLSMWLVRHTARTFLFYVVGILATCYLGLFARAEGAASYRDVLYSHLTYAVAGYGAAHLLVYLYEARFMGLLSRSITLYRDERRASTTIFTLAVISCGLGAVLAAFRLAAPASLIMLGVMALVFLLWSFVWLRGEMLYPAVLMVTLGILSVWHNVAHPTDWTPHRVGINALIFGLSALVWVGIGHRLHGIRGEVFHLASPARACSVILGVLGIGFAVALAVSPAFPAAVWRETRDAGDWALGLSVYSALILYFAWAGTIFDRRFYHLMSGVAVLALGLYVGIYVGVGL